ncbi:MAG: peptidoglycan DD-metalloendopeptidase family protein, partial [Candidatus Promineifilaceae bacterium]|nr:peptidoglycan DD-metalloendopeptidase family protein [Candidatus Promineifilaceae bacterium]
GGYLSEYSEEVEQRELSGAEVVELIARRFSIGPRLLLAVVEHQSGWVTAHPTEPSPYPLGFVREGTEGLYWQLHLAANLLNLGFYGRAEGGLTVLQVGSDSEVAIAPGLNDGSAGVQLLAGGLTNTSYEQWQTAVGSQGFYATYQRLFGNPFAYTVDPLLPSDLNQPELTLPWAVGETWYYTSGPHGAWASGSAWAALDFAPPGDVLGCYRSDHWVLTMSAGTVVYSDFGAVVVDIDGDGFAGTGWAITYMHLESRDRVPEGQTVTAGHRLGHPSCEGGFSNGTHVHVARSYNGRWISADGGLPFVMDGWTTQGLGREYDGLLIRDDLVREACSCREANNAVTRLPDG